MNLEYLQRIQRADFPMRVQDARDIACVAELNADGFITASVPPTAGEHGEVAIVNRITPLGWFELMRLP